MPESRPLHFFRVDPGRKNTGICSAAFSDSRGHSEVQKVRPVPGAGAHALSRPCREKFLTNYSESVQWANFSFLSSFSSSFFPFCRQVFGSQDATVTTLDWGGGCFSCTLHVTCADDESPCLCPRDAGLSPLPGDGLAVQRWIFDLRDLRPRDYAAGALE